MHRIVSTGLYVDPSLTITDMYEAYGKVCEKAERKVLSLSSYTRKLNKMNISFAKLGHEQCETCLKHEVHGCVASSEHIACKCCKRSKTMQCGCCRRFLSAWTIAKTKNKIVKVVNCDNNNCKCCQSHEYFKEQVEKKKEECNQCVFHKQHLERSYLARIEYKKDKKLSEDPDLTESVYMSLDLQKVRMIPEIPGIESAVFTQRICVYNESFSPIGENIGQSLAVLWHQGTAGRNDEDIASCFHKFCRHELVRSYTHVVFLR